MKAKKHVGDKKSRKTVVANQDVSPAKVLLHSCNNIKKMREALAVPDLAGIEFDVVVTQDGMPVLGHDKAITYEYSSGMLKPLSSPVEIASLTFENFRRMRPDMDTLKEALHFLDNQRRVGKLSTSFELHMEIKTPDTRAWDTIAHVLELYPVINSQTVLRSFQEEVLAYAKRKQPERKICLMIGSKSGYDAALEFDRSTHTSVKKLPTFDTMVKFLGGNTPNSVSVDYQLLTDGFIHAMKAQGVEVGVDAPGDVAGLSEVRVDRIVTDTPEEILRSLK